MSQSMKDVKAITIPIATYRELEYIEFDNNGQYIDTGYKCLWDDTVEMKLSYNQSSTNIQGSGIYADTIVNARIVYECNVLGERNGYAYVARGNIVTNTNITMPLNTDVIQKTVVTSRYTITHYVDNQSQSLSTSDSIQDDVNNFTVGSVNNYGDPVWPYKGGKVYYVKLGSSRNLIPAQRKVDNVVGLYDLVTNTFYSNSGTGTIIAGPVVSEYPSWDPIITASVKKITDSNGNMIWGSYDAFPYRRLEYLKFSGSEYIMTGWQGKQGYPKEIKFSIDSDNFYPSAYTFVTGTYDGSPANNRRRYYVRPSVDTASSTVSQYGIDVCMGNTWASSSKSFDIDQPYIARVSCYQDETNNNYRTMQIYVLDGDTSTQKWYTNVSSGTTSTVTSKALALMANNSTSIEYMTKGKLYYAKEYSGGSTYAQRGYANWTYLAGYYPVQRKSDGVCGLYRVDNGTFMPMVGTNITSAAAGPVVDEYWDLQEPT